MMYHYYKNDLKAGLPRRFAPRNDLSAFTLAEVLITLGIIGVVAALTMPSVITKIEKQKNINVLKKASSEIMNYVSDFKQSENCTDISLCWSEENIFNSQFAQYLLDKKKFKEYVPFGRATNAGLIYSAFKGKTVAGSCPYIYNGYGYSDGKIEPTAFCVPLVSPSGSYMVVMSNNHWGYTMQGKHFVAMIYVLTNNKRFGNKDARFPGDLEKHPNDFPSAGVDLFRFYIMEDGRMVPEGSELCKGGKYYCRYWEESGTCNPEDSTSTGIGCFSRIIEDGWQIKYY